MMPFELTKAAPVPFSMLYDKVPGPCAAVVFTVTVKDASTVIVLAEVMVKVGVVVLIVTTEFVLAPV
jgi:hypothetical protein